MHRRQSGAGGFFIAIVLLLIAGGILAAFAFLQSRGQGERTTQVDQRFDTINAAMVQFVAMNGRLPCPTNPTLDDGVEGNPVAGECPVGTQEGTVPWRSIGARREDAIDSWGGKISYRVYTGNAGSLTQVDGASMVQCDGVEAAPAGVTPVTGSAGGLCRPDNRVTFRNTLPANFLSAAKGLQVTDFGTVRTGVAYVLVSHGPTGLGAYTSAGVRRDLPAAGSDERANTTATGPFVSRAASPAGTDSTSAAHFDDQVAFRRLEELVALAGRGARDWPESIQTTTTTSFDQATVEEAVGSAVTPGGSVGLSTVSFTGVSVSGRTSGGAALDVTFVDSGSNPGLGVSGGGSALVQSSANELLRLDVERGTSKFAVTLGEFGTYSGTFIELVQFRFFASGTPVGATRFGVACNPDGGLASFTMDVGAVFDRVEIMPLPAYNTATGNFTGITALLLAQIAACPASAPSCTTALATPGNTCTLL